MSPSQQEQKGVYEQVAREHENRVIIDQNLRMLTSDQARRMIMKESRGMNAGVHEDEGFSFGCVAINATVDSQTGEIKEFTNYRDVDRDKAQGRSQVTFRRASRLEANKPGHAIVETIFKDRSTGQVVSADAAARLVETVERYNISAATSWDTLKFGIRALPGLKGSEKFYEPEEVTGIIDKVRSGKLGTEYLTNRGGLREKVKQLMAAER